MSTINLGIVYEPYPLELSELSSSIIDLTGTPPEKERVIAYDGPNEIVQLLVDAANWKHALSFIAVVLGGKFAASFATELGKQAAAEVWREKRNYYDAIKSNTIAPFQRIIKSIQALRAKNQTVTIAVKIPGTPRNAGLVLTSNDQTEIAWQIANVIRYAEEIERTVKKLLEENPHLLDSGQNADMSFAIDVLENGDVRILGITLTK
nr:hypothetical protein [uncultured Pseudomonas sp.]